MFNGVLVNGAAVIVGSLLGIIFKNIPEEMKETVTQGIGVGVVALGIKMAIQTDSFIIIMISLCIGAMLGEWMGIEKGMNNLGLALEKRFARSGGTFAEGFVTATLIFLIGSMSIIGAIESGVAGNHATLYTKAVMDGFMSIMLTASFGIGVMFSAIPILIYQGAIALGASVLVTLISPELMDLLMSEISAIGGIMICAIGLNVMHMTKIRVSNFLPGLLVLVLIMCAQYFWF